MSPEQTHQKAVHEALVRLGPDIRAIQLTAFEVAIRALFAAHPDQAQAKLYMDQGVAQLLAGSFIAGNPDRALVLRDLTTRLFQPASPQDTN